MDVSKHILLLATHPSFDMGLDRAANGANYFWGESVSLINFIKVHVAFVYVFHSVFWLANVSLLTAQYCAFYVSSLTFGSRICLLQQRSYRSNCTADRSPSADVILLVYTPRENVVSSDFDSESLA